MNLVKLQDLKSNAIVNMRMAQTHTLKFDDANRSITAEAKKDTGIAVEEKKDGSVDVPVVKISRRYIKNIKCLFSALSNMIHYRILLVDPSKVNEKFILPSNIDKLILLMGYYPDAFDENLNTMLYQLISAKYYSSLYTMSNIVDGLYDITDNIDNSSFILDYYIVYENIMHILQYGFEIDSDYEDSVVVSTLHKLPRIPQQQDGHSHSPPFHQQE